MTKNRDEDREEEPLDEEELKDSELPDESDVTDGRESGTYRCPYCGKDVYEDAIRCPACGRYVSPEDAKGRHPIQWVILAVLLAMAALAVWILTR